MSDITVRCWTEVTVGGVLTRSLCGPGQTPPHSIRLYSLSPPGRADAAGKARSLSPNKHEPSPCRSNSGSKDGEEDVVLIVMETENWLHLYTQVTLLRF